MKIVVKRQTLYAGLAAALLLTSSLTAVSVVVSRAALADASEEASVQAFFQKGYSICDADVLARFWQIEFWDAKVRGGEMVQRGQLRLLSDKLSYSYRDHVCGGMSALDYDDATQVAALWTAPSQA